jgi:hypothetical protein
MAKKITYLLGAGASANAIPVVSDMYFRIKEIIEFLNKRSLGKGIIEGMLTGTVSVNTLDYVGKFDGIINDLKWLSHEAESYPSIDTLAKTLYLSGDEKYHRLKSCLIVYFILEQFTNIPSYPNKNKGYHFAKNSIDKRYSNFIASIGKKVNQDFILNSDIKILSWNYDLQIELSLRNIVNDRIHLIKQNHEIHPNANSYNSVTTVIKDNHFAVVKLNGNAVWDTIDAKNNRYTIFDDTTTNPILKFLDYYQNYQKGIDGHRQYLNFSWEALDNNSNGNYHGYKGIISESEKIAAETEILVVIGYSFPNFNREMDSRLFNKMGNLRKVYIQDKFPENIKTTMVGAFKKLQKISPTSWSPEIILEKNTDQFIVPFELGQ